GPLPLPTRWRSRGEGALFRHLASDFWLLNPHSLRSRGEGHYRKLPANTNPRLMPYREIDRAGDKALAVRLVMRRFGDGEIGAGRHPYNRAQRDFGEMPAAPLQDHGPRGLVFIAEDGNAPARTDGEIGEHMARRQCRDQQIFRIVKGGVAAEVRIGRALERRFARNRDRVLPGIGSVVARPSGDPTGPYQPGRIMMIARHHLSSRPRSGVTPSAATGPLRPGTSR